MTDPFAFHPFVCLCKSFISFCLTNKIANTSIIAILLSAKEALEDLEQSEIRTMLLRLPLLNMEMVCDLVFCMALFV
jgi:hypothetical protein